MNLLIVEDDVLIRNAIEKELEKEKYRIFVAKDGIEALDIFARETIHLILLDLMLPKLRGEIVLQKVRHSSDVPVLVISALSDEVNQMEAFRNRVDDYVVKPFSLNILTYKIKSVLRRTYGADLNSITYGRLKIIPSNYEVFIDDDLIMLSSKDFEILHVLLTNQGRVFDRQELITLVWGYKYFGDLRNIDVHIKNIRKKTWPDLIVTVKGVGYKIEKSQLKDR